MTDPTGPDSRPRRRPHRPADGGARRARNTCSVWLAGGGAVAEESTAAGSRRRPRGGPAARRGHLLPPARAAEAVHPAVRRPAGGRGHRALPGPGGHSQFSRTDGCEIARWRAMAPLLGGVAGSTGASLRPAGRLKQATAGGVNRRPLLLFAVRQLRLDGVVRAVQLLVLDLGLLLLHFLPFSFLSFLSLCLPCRRCHRDRRCCPGPRRSGNHDRAGGVTSTLTKVGSLAPAKVTRPM